MKYLVSKISLILALLLVVGCSEDNLNITSPQDFVLLTPEASNINLNFAFPDNPAFTLTWRDNVTHSGSYNVEMAADGDFTTPMALGTSTTDTFTMSVADFNNALISAGINAYENTSIFMRVLAGSMVSNTVVFSVNSYPETPPVITSPDNGFSIVLSDATPDDTAVTVEWEDPDFNTDPTNTQVSINYDVEVALAGTDFAAFASLGSVDDAHTLAVTHSDLNSAAITAGLVAEEMGSLDLRIKATIVTASGNMERYSDSITMDVTPYSTSAGLSTWGVVGSGYNNWGAFADAPFYTTQQPNIIVSYVTLVTGEIKFRENNDWGSNFGDTGADGTLDNGGDNIVVSAAGTYKITINFNDNTYTMEQYSLGIVGSGYNDWGNAGPDAKFYYDYTTDTFKVGVKLLDGEVKFRLNNDWGTNYGGSGGALSLNGSNIAVTAGYYTVTVDFNNSTYSIVADDILGVVGSGYNDWGNAGPDFALTEVNPDIWVGDIVTLIDGEIKFRINNDWGTNYGGSGGSLSLNGSNIAVTAGLYRVRIDLANSTYQLNQVQ
ncbi:MAG: SusE domain-containing protein [Gelidibacter sp.]